MSAQAASTVSEAHVRIHRLQQAAADVRCQGVCAQFAPSRSEVISGSLVTLPPLCGPMNSTKAVLPILIDIDIHHLCLLVDRAGAEPTSPYPRQYTDFCCCCHRRTKQAVSCIVPEVFCKLRSHTPSPRAALLLLRGVGRELLPTPYALAARECHLLSSSHTSASLESPSRIRFHTWHLDTTRPGQPPPPPTTTTTTSFWTTTWTGRHQHQPAYWITTAAATTAAAVATASAASLDHFRLQDGP